MKGTLFTISLFLIVNVITPCADVGSDIYSGWSGAFSQFADPNTGLTVFPTLLVPMGGRYEGMGTAYTAMALDAGAMESNPAVSSILKSTEIEFTHHSWISDSNLESVLYAVRFNALGLGVGGKMLYVPFSSYNDWGDTKNKAYITETVGLVNVSYNFLESYDFCGLAAGSNIKVAYRNIPTVFSANQSAFAVMTDVGLQTSFNLLKFYHSRSKNFSVGLVLKNLGISSLAGEQLPLMATAGVAYTPLRPWTIACDFSYPFSLDPLSSPAESPNLAIGTNINVTSFLSLQSGILFKADNPRLSLGSTIDLGQVTFVVNYNLDLSGQINPLDKFSVQAKLNLGDFGRGARAAEVDRLYLEGLEEYSDGNYAKALECWKKVLALDPLYAPALESIDTVQQTMMLQQQLESARVKD